VNPAVTHELHLLAALVMGLAGSTHCVAMCGGISCALSAGLPKEVRSSPTRMLPYVLAYNAGRIASYGLAGVLVGLVGGRAAHLLPAESAQIVGMVIAAGFFVALGLYLGGWWRGLEILEKLGARLWRHVEPLGRRFLPVGTPGKALGVGLVWGWLPCGLVYAALALALTTGNGTGGALTMLAFGVGTLPALITLGYAGRWLSGQTRRVGVRRVAGAALCLAGVATLALGLAGEHGHQPAGAMVTVTH
jgi:sulfite exporter TauE/SafE